ncbi:MAG: hypothetical protein ISP82_06675 [Candidatus Poseidoniaceae archaeon]|nr:hypothetical protein [Candidatus Poseidoniaceae archaeon]MBL6896016.1 hypothetical protein [Candidatus Poseidoniaceae archaeon]
MDSDTEQLEDASQDLLAEYETSNVSLVSLARTLLSSSTMPHIILVTILSAILYITSSADSLTNISAMAFTSLSIGYGISAITSNSTIVKNWITLDDEETDERPFLIRNLAKFRICIFPLVMAFISLLAMLFLFGENGVIPIGDGVIPLVMGSLFVVWSIVQGTSFTKWASSASAKLTDKQKPTYLQMSVLFSIGIIALISSILATIFYQIDNFNLSISGAFLDSLLFTSIAVLVLVANIGYNWQLKKLASMKYRLHNFSNRWTIICHVFISWHLLTLWRQIFLDPTEIQVLFEELVLMIFTVFIAIWSMTAKGYKSSFRPINEENALSWGLAFGYAYAGSVAMLTTVFNDITTVMQIGHTVVIIAVLYIHRKVLTDIIGQDNLAVEVNRIVEHSESKNPQIQDEEFNDTEDATVENNSNEDSWQADDDVDWEKEETTPVIEDVEWDTIIEVD